MPNNPTLIPDVMGVNAEKNSIPTTDNGTTGKASIKELWQSINSLPLSAGGKAVDRLDFNGLFSLLGGIDYMTQRGYTFEWDSNLPYVVGCIVIDETDGKTYRCVNDVLAGGSAPSVDNANWIPYDIADYVGGALRVTAYSVGDTSTLPNIPAGYYLEATTGGITGTTAPVVTTPVSVGQTIADGTVVWTVRQVASKHDLLSYLPLVGGGSLTGSTLTWNGGDLGGSAIISKFLGGGGGYIKRASGEIIQSSIIDNSGWTASGGMYYKNITFPISFTSGTTFSFVALAQQISGISTNVHVTQCNYGGSTVQIWATASCQFRYIAFGY